MQVLRLIQIAMAACILAAPSTSFAQIPDSEALSLDGALGDYVIGSTYFFLLHEFAHVIISDYQVPLLAMEEDSADTIAIVSMIRLDERFPDRDLRHGEMLAMAAYGYRVLWDAGPEQSDPELFYWTQHGLSLRRFYRMACLLYGSDPGRFGWVPDAVEMPYFRGELCEKEFQAAADAVDWIVDTFARPRLGGNQRLRRIKVSYEEPRYAYQFELQELLRDEAILEDTAGLVESYFRLPEEMNLSVRSCVVPNAYWDAEARELTICYEFLEFFSDLATAEDLLRIGERFR